MTVTTLPSALLRSPAKLLSDIAEERELGARSAHLLILNIVLFSLSGALMGSVGGMQQALASSGKMPLLFLLTMAITLPTLHIVNLAYGANHSLGQLVNILLGTLACTGTVLLACAPITTFFLISGCEYSFFVLMNVAVLGMAAIFGLRFLTKGMAFVDNRTSGPETAPVRQKILAAWILIYAFVGCQLSWTMRPFFGNPEQQFEFFRKSDKSDGNFYTAITKKAFRSLGVD